MKKTIALSALALLLLFAGCDYFGVAIEPGSGAAQGSGDPEVGGGLADPLAEEAGGGQVPVGGGGGGAGSAGTDRGGGTANEAPAVEPAGEIIDLPGLTPGDSHQRGEVTFTLEQVRIESTQLVVQYSLTGLADGYIPARSEPLVQLANGTVLSPTGGAGGGGRPPGETYHLTFPALPPGTVQFTLLLGNQWSGTLEFWQVPVSLKQLK